MGRFAPRRTIVTQSSANRNIQYEGEGLQEDEDMNETDSAYSEVDDEAEESDEDSDYETAQKATGPANKRAKMEASSVTPATKGQGKKSLTLMVTMPLDVLFEIFSNLAPRDILHLLQTSKMFHYMLMAKNATIIWKGALERARAPDCPIWMNKVTWTKLLFGHTCNSCGTDYIYAVDFFLLRRLCISCQGKHYVSQTTFPKQYSELDMDILDLIPRTTRQGYCDFRRRSYYWDGDIASVVKRLTAFGQDILNGFPNARILLHDFKEEQKKRIEEIKQKHREWDCWFTTFQDRQYNRTRDAMESRFELIKQKFRDLGYIDDDLLSLQSTKECQQPKQLTEKIWRRIRPILEPQIQEAKNRRLEDEMDTLRYERTETLRERYHEFQRSLPPSRWKYLPSLSEICYYDAFAKLLDADLEVNVTAPMFDSAFETFPGDHATATAKHKSFLSSLLPSCLDAKEEGEVDEAIILELATAVFRCQSTNAHHLPLVFGWDDIASHHCESKIITWLPFYRTIAEAVNNPGAPRFRYCGDAAKVVEKLVELSGLDPTKATATDMDQKNLRFSCAACSPLQTDKEHRWRLGYAWRFMVEHLITSMFHNPTLEIGIIPVTQANEVKQCENDFKNNQDYWSCAHCPEYLGKLQKREVVLQHLNQIHGISTPSEPTDLFFFERYKLALLTKPKYYVGTPLDDIKLRSVYRCLLCTKGKQSQRTFMFPGLQAHLETKHQIQSVERGVHYTSH